MLSPLALVLALQGPPQGPSRPSATATQVLEAVRSAGYAVTPTDTPSRGDRTRFAQVVRGRDAVELYVDARRLGYTVYAQIEVPRDVDGAALRKWEKTALPLKGFHVSANLGPTVDAMAMGELAPELSPEDVKARLDGVFDALDAVAAHVGGSAPKAPRAEWRDARFPDATVLRIASLESLRRAFRSWGWLERPGTPFAPGGWAQGLTVEGKRVYARSVPQDGHPSDTAFEVVAIDPKGPGVASPVEESSPGQRVFGRDAKDHPGELMIGTDWHKPAAETTIDLVSSLTLGEMRRRIEAFAKASGYAGDPPLRVGGARSRRPI